MELAALSAASSIAVPDTTAPASRFRGVHMVGSIPLANADEVFSVLGRTFGTRLTRIPDGETGERTNWVQFQTEVFRRTPGLEPVPAEVDPRNAGWHRPRTTQYRLRAGATLTSNAFPPLGFADSAIASYQRFAARVAEGTLPASSRFLVALPTPFCVIHFGIAPESRAAVEPSYQARLLQELDAVCAAIPHDRLAVQWDSAHDTQAFDGARQAWFAPAREGIIDRLTALGERLPADVELGYHFCYGSFGGRHFVEPASTKAMVDLCNGVLAKLRHPVSFVHMPVPIERADDAYYEPLQALRLPEVTELYLGLVHDADGVAGTLARVAVAQRHYGRFGIAAECGFGRRPSADVAKILATHVEVLEKLEEITR